MQHSCSLYDMNMRFLAHRSDKHCSQNSILTNGEEGEGDVSLRSDSLEISDMLASLGIFGKSGSLRKKSTMKTYLELL